MKVYLAQLKCPQNHCVFAVAGEYESDEAANELALRLGFEVGAMVKAGEIKHECTLCLATALRVEIGRTRFATMAEAEPHLRENQDRINRSIAFLKAAKN
jgi:hypothetical protein